MATTESVLADARRMAAHPEMLRPSDVESIKRLVDKTDDIASPNSGIPFLRESLAKYETEPTERTASRLLHSFLWTWLEHHAYLRTLKSDNGSQMARVEALGAGRGVSALTGKDLSEIKSVIENAGQYFIAIWPPPPSRVIDEGEK